MAILLTRMEEEIMQKQKEKAVVNKEYEVSKVREISVSFNGNLYLVIYGKHVNGGFFSIPNWQCGGELSDYNYDILWNTESINRSLKDKKAARAIAEVIAHIN